MTEVKVRGLAGSLGRSENHKLPFELDGFTRSVTVRISGLSKQMVAELPDLSLDLLEIAALVYAADASVRRGGPTDARMGERWYRSFHMELPVRCKEIWAQEDLSTSLVDLLSYLSGDRFRFSFSERERYEGEQGFFKFDPLDAWQADRVLMFSGGLDSFAGALEEMVEQNQKVALVSHFSATKIAPGQRKLKAALEAHCGDTSCRHLPVRIQLGQGANRETTHRTRSFLFATLGMIVAQSFGRDRVSFYENGVVSLNLPPVANVVSTRATRSTHPKALALMTRFFSSAFARPARIDNPYFWRTKTEVVQTIARLGMAERIVETNSCADTRNRTVQHPHCGRCSQCIDRRFAILAAGLEDYDPDEAYAVPLFEGRRTEVRDREIALSYVRRALDFEVMTPGDLLLHFPEILDAVNDLEQSHGPALKLMHDLLQRHGKAVARVMRNKAPDPRKAEFDTLPEMFGKALREGRLGKTAITPDSTETVKPQIKMMLCSNPARITINDNIQITGPSAVRLLSLLGEAYLNAAGKGLDPLDYPCITASTLAKTMGITEESLRTQIKRVRNNLNNRLQGAGLEIQQGLDIIENLAWSGYRLNPDLVVVRRRPQSSKTSPSSA